MTHPTLKLVSGQMVARMTYNIRAALLVLPVRNVYGWCDSTVALYWINGQGIYKQFVSSWPVKKVTKSTELEQFKYKLLAKHSFWKAMQITARLKPRFVNKPKIPFIGEVH